MRYHSDDRRFQAHLHGVVAMSGGLGDIVSARAREHPLVLTTTGGIGIRDQRSLPGFIGNPGTIQVPHSPAYTGGDWERSRQRVAKQIASDEVAEERIAGRTRASAAAFSEGIVAEELGDEELSLFQSVPSILDERLDSEATGLSSRITDPLGAARIDTVEDLIARSEQELLQVRGFGPHALHRVRQFLAEYELKLKSDE